MGPVQQFLPGQTVEVEWAYITTKPDKSQCPFGFPESDVRHIRQFYKNDVHVVGINETAAPLSSEVLVYPNPADEQIHVQVGKRKDEAELTLVDVTGQVRVESKLLTNSTSIDVSSLSSGIYFVRLKQDSRVSNHKVVVQ